MKHMKSNYDDIILKGIKRAIKISTNCKSEEGVIRPKVGAVIIKNNKIVQEAYRGELKEGEHAEFTALIKKKVDVDYTGSILITTLEPCTSRKHGKLTCAEHIVNSGIAHVWIGILDPNKKIRGKGEIYLMDNGVLVDHFPSQYSSQILAINEDFWKEMTKDYQRDIMSTGEGQEKNPHLEIFFENKSKEITIPKRNSEPTYIVNHYSRDFRRLTFLDPTKEQIEEYNAEVDEYNAYRKRVSNSRTILFILKNSGQAPATNIDIDIRTTLQSDFEIEMALDRNEIKPPKTPSTIYSTLDSFKKISPIPPQRPSRLPNIQYKSAEVIDHNLVKEWEFGYHIQNLKHTRSVILYPVYLIIPDNTEVNEIVLSVNTSVQEPITFPNDTLRIILSDEQEQKEPWPISK